MRSLLRRLVDPGTAGSLASRMRRGRFARFASIVADLPRPVRILDVGGTESYWLAQGVTPASGFAVTLLNLQRAATTAPFVTSVAGDARDLSRYADRAFDVVFSNSVIEHVGELADQEAMAREVRRVGVAYYVQTPNRRFPIEPHFLLPYFQYWPVAWQVALVQRFDVGWYKRAPDAAAARALVDSHRLLAEAELRALFPDATIEHERVLGLTKSLIAYRRA
jgi:hypothetical protein